MKKTKIIAFESANGFVKVFHEGKSKVYPNTMSKAALETFNTGNENQVNKKVYTFDSERYVAGETYDYISSASDGVDRYGSAYYLRESLVAIDQFVEDGDKVIVCTGIPANHYDDKDLATKLITKTLKGSHSYEVNGESKTFSIKNVIVTLQPLATFFYTVVDEFGAPDEQMIARYNDSFTLVVDIGWKTTDVAVIRDNQLMSWDTLKTSMETAYLEIRDRLKAQAKEQGKKLASAKVQLLEIEKQLRRGDAFKHANQLHEASIIKREVFTSIAADIVREAKAFKSFEEFTTIIFTGGGTEALEEYLDPYFIDDKSGKHDENIFILTDTQLANCKGYFVYASYLQ